MEKNWELRLAVKLPTFLKEEGLLNRGSRPYYRFQRPKQLL